MWLTSKYWKPKIYSLRKLELLSCEKVQFWKVLVSLHSKHLDGLLSLDWHWVSAKKKKKDCWPNSCPEDYHWHSTSGWKAHKPIWSLHSLIIWTAMSSAGGGPICFLKTRHFLRELFMLSYADKLFGNAGFNFQPTRPNVGLQKAGSMSITLLSWLKCEPGWPETHGDVLSRGWEPPDPTMLWPEGCDQSVLSFHCISAVAQIEIHAKIH